MENFHENAGRLEKEIELTCKVIFEELQMEQNKVKIFQVQ